MPTPEEIYETVTADIIRAETRLAELQSETARLKKRIKDAHKLIGFLEKTYNIKRPKETIQIITNGKPEGITVIDPSLECPECGFQADKPNGLAIHALKKHGLNWKTVKAKSFRQR